MPASRLLAVPALSLAAVLALAGCVPNSASGAAISVTSSADACTLSADTAPSGTIVFTVTNTGDQVTEFYLLADDGLRIVAEVENIGPGLSRDLVLTAAAGDYITVCKPGLTGDGIGRAPFTVTDSGAAIAPTGDAAERVDAATDEYAEYVEEQIDELLAGTREFAAAYIAGQDDAARTLYAPTRMHWERIETVAESFGDLDPRMDLREADLEEGQAWTGWHAIEKDLWPAEAEPGFVAYDTATRTTLADQLIADTEELQADAATLEFTIDQLANGAIGLLDEVASGKVTGEEEAWSHTDLWDFQANVDGARVLFSTVRGILEITDAELATELESRFDELQSRLDAQRVGDGFRTYTELSTDEIRGLSDAVNALAEPLSRLTASVLA